MLFSDIHLENPLDRSLPMQPVAYKPLSLRPPKMDLS